MTSPAADVPRTILGVVLAGGLSRRMGRDKAALRLGGIPLAIRALERLRPQVTALAFNGAPAFPGLAPDIETIPDAMPGVFGPLAGILAGLRLAQSRDIPLVASVPVDAPFFPCAFVRRLLSALQETNTVIAVAASRDTLHPVFALWSSSLADDLERFIAADAKRRVRGFIEQHPHVVVDFTETSDACEDIDPFTNMNRPGDVEMIERMLFGAGTIKP
ncbi:molybdenum cofactor guanylyltransferase MobA [Rhizobium sp. 9140]|uniref:molybdenum cofactor guanylyltransferase MobA n=1 Tax=Rhizobium sp. 9140 TaxID=1761900 RepID=UPI00079724DE|nr:molybdenum cofactor guanylyltransferase MobA [Rhizobium sp. 9140]CZT35091.1 molybdopterin-guanine dinucleotide biosynthesis protein A [Rhizobium sp. 9140]